MLRICVLAEKNGNFSDFSAQKYAYNSKLEMAVRSKSFSVGQIIEFDWEKISFYYRARVGSADDFIDPLLVPVSVFLTTLAENTSSSHTRIVFDVAFNIGEQKV